MAVIQDGVNGSVLQGVDPNMRSARVTMRPIVSATLGSYKCSMRSGLMTNIAADTIVGSFRYAGTGLCIVERVIIDGLAVTGTLMAAAQAYSFQLLTVRASFTSNDTGGNAAILTGNNLKLRTSYATTAVADIRVSSTAALGASGTGTADNALSNIGGAIVGMLAPVGSGAATEMVLHDAYSCGHPIILAQNEGFRIMNRHAWPATGTAHFGFTAQWTEVTAAEWA